ncbi:hypothetical protein [Methanocella arvoryzae]|nr:hypothetical protein [Methanocella arvoryzae]
MVLWGGITCFSAYRVVVAAALFVVALILLLSTLTMLATVLVSAHKPVFEGVDTSGYSDAVQIPDPEVSWAIYGYIDSTGDADYYYFDIDAPVDVYTELLVPKKSVYDDFYPSYAIVGPKLPDSPGLPFEVPGSCGAVVVDSPPGDRETFYEPFTGINYYRGFRKHTLLSEPGRYYVVVYDRSHASGDYVLAVGEKESFGLRDIPGVVADVLKIRSGSIDHS